MRSFLMIMHSVKLSPSLGDDEATKTRPFRKTDVMVGFADWVDLLKNEGPLRDLRRYLKGMGTWGIREDFPIMSI